VLLAGLSKKVTAFQRPLQAANPHEGALWRETQQMPGKLTYAPVSHTDSYNVLLNKYRLAQNECIRRHDNTTDSYNITHRIKSFLINFAYWFMLMMFIYRVKT
jgi:hypothetical protein